MAAKNFTIKMTVVLMITVIVVLVVAEAQNVCLSLRKERVEPGVCAPILQCEPIVKLLNEVSKPPPPWIVQLIQRIHCGSENGVHYVCCDPKRVAVTTPTSQPPVTLRPVSTRHRSVDKSEEDIQAGMAILEGTKCGKSNADRIANGIESNLSEYPWMALLIYSDGVVRTIACGGSLITDQYVLTAAHCTGGIIGTLVSVRLGEHNIDTAIDCQGHGADKKCAPPIQEIDIEETIYHKDYNRNLFSNDIALIRLTRKAEIVSNVRPICLPITSKSQAHDIDRMIIAGWGNMENGVKANILQKAVVSMRSNEVCEQAHQNIRLTDQQMCAAGENAIETCKGDSGGPVFCPTLYRRGVRYVQYGIVSAGGIRCGTSLPDVFVRIMPYLSWISGNIRS